MSHCAAKNAAHLQRAFARSLAPFRSDLWVFVQSGRHTKRRNRLRAVIQTDVGVLHRHVPVRVTGKLFRFDQADASSQKLGDVGVSARRMEVGDAIVVHIRNARASMDGAF